MADPRKKVNFSGIAQERATWKHDVSIVYDADNPTKYDGRAVKIVGDDTVGLCDNNDEIFAFIHILEGDGFIVLTFEGVVDNAHAGNAATVTAGSGLVGALNASSEKGFVKNAGGLLIASLDGNAATNVAVTGSRGRGYVLNAAVSTAIVVLLSR